MPGLRIRDHLDRMPYVEMELTKFSVFLWTVRHGVVNRLAPNDITSICGNDGFSIRFTQSMVRQWCSMGIFFDSCRMHCNPILALLEIARLAKIDWDATSVEWFPFQYL